jgi:hypothetical protein
LERVSTCDKRQRGRSMDHTSRVSHTHSQRPSSTTLHGAWTLYRRACGLVAMGGERCAHSWLAERVGRPSRNLLISCEYGSTRACGGEHALRDVGGGGRRGNGRCRLPVSSARKLKFYDRRDLNDLVRSHLEEKQQVLDENNCLRMLLLDRLNIGDEELENALVRTAVFIPHMLSHLLMLA